MSDNFKNTEIPDNSKAANKLTADEQIIGSVAQIPDVEAGGGRQGISVSKLKLALRALKHRNYKLFFGGQP